MKNTTREMIDNYYKDVISSQKLIQYIKTNETKTNEQLYSEYYNINNICLYCNSKMKYTGFKYGYRCSKSCSNRRKIKVKPNKKVYLTKDLILENITKQNFVSRKFLKENNLTEQECYNKVYKIDYCKYCGTQAEFKNWVNGYKITCTNKICKNKIRAEKTKKTNLEKYGTPNVSGNKEIQNKKQATFKRNYGVKNISQLPETQIKIRNTMERLGKWVKLSDKSSYDIYFKAASFKHGFKITKYTTEIEKEKIKELGIYNTYKNKSGVVRDHLLSRRYGFENNIPTWIISHPANCEFVTHSENLSRASRKEGDNLISIEDLLEKIYK